MVPAQLAWRKAHMFTEIQTAEHGTSSDEADNPDTAGSYLGQPCVGPGHALFKDEGHEGNNSPGQGGKGQDGTKQLGGFLIHPPILSCEGANPQAHDGGVDPYWWQA